MSSKIQFLGEKDIFKQQRVIQLLTSKTLNLYEVMALVLKTDMPFERFLTLTTKLVSDKEALLASDYRVNAFEIFHQYYHYTKIREARKKRDVIERELQFLNDILRTYNGFGMSYLVHEIGIRNRQLELAQLRDADKVTCAGQPSWSEKKSGLQARAHRETFAARERERERVNNCTIILL